MNGLNQVPLKDIAVGPNPRKRKSKTTLEELAASIKQSGVLEPILLRPNPNGDKAKPFLLVYGERRYQASLLAGLETIPAIAREMTDEEALEAQIVENLQREDVHFLDEAQGFNLMLAQGASLEQVAAKVGKPLVYVASRLSLARLIKPFHAYAYRDQLPVTVALRLSRLTAQVQKACMEDFTDGRKAETTYFSMGEVDSWLGRHVYLHLAKAPFDTADDALVPKAGACPVCPKRTGANKLLFSDFKEQDICTDPACYESKCNALIRIRMKEHPEAVQIAQGWMQGKEQQECDKAKILREFDYNNKSKGYRLSKKDECPNTVQAIVAMGEPHLVGKLVYVCTVATCKVHTGTGRVKAPRKLGEIDPERAKQQEQLWQRRTSRSCREALHVAIVAKQQQLAEKAKPNPVVPLEALRAAVHSACSSMRPSQDGTKYLETVWFPKQKPKEQNYGGRSLLPLIEKADQSTLLRLLLDFSIADDVASKFSTNTTELSALAKAYGVDDKKVTEPIVQDWHAKKAASYAKRTARLAKERAKVKKQAEAKEAKAKPEAKAEKTEALAKK